VKWTEALEIVVARTRHEPYRLLTADDHPDRDIWRQRMVEKATGVTPGLPPAPVVSQPVYPSALEMAGNALGAAGRFVAAWWKGDQTTVDTKEVERRLTICMSCPKFDRGQVRCTICGCFSKFKTKLATEHCPLPPEEGGPKW
jgi:hypothetical protein